MRTYRFVAGTDVYVAGRLDDNRAMYWKNGLAVSITDSFSSANSIFVSGTDVYVAGNGLDSNTRTAQAKYWKNVAPNFLSPDPKNTTVASAIVVSGPDVHVVGHVNYKTAIYWKNGVATNLAVSTFDGGATSIFIID